jgi:hypothetical protein
VLLRQRWQFNPEPAKYVGRVKIAVNDVIAVQEGTGSGEIEQIGPDFFLAGPERQRIDSFRCQGGPVVANGKITDADRRGAGNIRAVAM